MAKRGQAPFKVMYLPAYRNLFRSGELSKRRSAFLEKLADCMLCPRQCKVNRIKGEKGFCAAGLRAKIFSYQAHFGEEPPISGRTGSGTIFFSYCNSRCLYCQNWRFSLQGEGRKVSTEELSRIMLELQSMGCHNINLVTPTHYLPQILDALSIAAESGLNLPLVYNTSGYESLEILKLLDGIIDIYLADMRYGDSQTAKLYSQMTDYTEINSVAIREMYRQVGNLIIEDDIAYRGLIIRHLVLPNNLAQTAKVMYFIKEKISSSCFISLMSQYYPFYKAKSFPLLDHPITRQEYKTARRIAFELGLDKGWIQGEMDELTQKEFAGEYFRSL